MSKHPAILTTDRAFCSSRDTEAVAVPFDVTDAIGLTPEETEILNALAAAWRLWCDLPDRHPDDPTEFRLHVHALQNLVAWRVARRVNPDVWR